MTYTVHVGGIGEVCRVPSKYYTEAYLCFNNYALSGYTVILLRDGETLRAHAKP